MITHLGMHLVPQPLHDELINRALASGRITQEEHTLLTHLPADEKKNMVAAFSDANNDAKTEFIGLGFIEHDVWTRWGDERSVVYERLETIHRERFEGAKKGSAPKPPPAGPTSKTRRGRVTINGIDIGEVGGITFTFDADQWKEPKDYKSKRKSKG